MTKKFIKDNRTGESISPAISFEKKTNIYFQIVCGQQDYLNSKFEGTREWL